MKRVLVPLPKKDFKVEFKIPGEGKKELIAIGGVFYCPECGYKMIPEIQSPTKPYRKAKFYLDVACLCDQK